MNDRVIDLSYTAAYKLGILGNGSAEVEVESLNPDVSVNTIAANSVQSQPLESSAPISAVAAVPVEASAVIAAPPAATPSAVLAPPESKDSAVYLQLGAFSSQAGAAAYLDKMRSKLGDTGKQLKLTTKDGLVRVHIGPYANLSEARNSADSMEGKLGFKPMVNLP